VDMPTVDAEAGDAEAGAVPDGVSPTPPLRRVIRNRRELFLVIALIVELVSNAIIIWNRPRAPVPVDPPVADEGRGN